MSSISSRPATTTARPALTRRSRSRSAPGAALPRALPQHAAGPAFRFGGRGRRAAGPTVAQPEHLLPRIGPTPADGTEQPRRPLAVDVTRARRRGAADGTPARAVGF